MVTKMLNLETLVLKNGSHSAESGEVCLLEAVSVAAGEPFSDHPETTCPVLAAYGRRLNDRLNDTDRQRLVPFVDKLKGTRSTKAVEARRGWLAVDHTVRVSLPKWMEAAGHKDHADALRSLPPITDAAGAAAATPLIHAAHQPVKGSWWNYRSKVRAAVEAELKKRGRPAAADAATAADADAVAAAVAAAAAAAGRWSEIYSAAYKAARKVFDEKFASNPALQGGVDDAIALFDRMIEQR